jgi:hypothetical protein
MRTHYLIRRIAGTFVLASLALGHWVSPYWYLFTAFVGLNLLQSSFTRWCFVETILAKAGVGGERYGRESDAVVSRS